MSNTKIPKVALRHSRIGIRMIFIMFLAVVLGICVYMGITKLGEWAQNSMIYERLFSSEYKRRMVNELQDFVTNNELSSSDYTKIKIWLTDNVGIGFLYDQNAQDASEFTVQFADRAVSVLPYVTYNGYDQIINLIAAAISFATVVLSISPFTRRVSSDIKHLSEDMAVLAGGDLSHEIKLKGKTELVELAQSIDEMRLSIAARMQRESEAIAANQELITALSHDLRTPLTKQMSYLELAMSGRFSGDDAGMQKCLERAHKATCQLKERTEELFSYFLVFSDASSREQVLEEVDGTLVLKQLLDDQASFLSDRGFNIETTPISQELRLRVYLPALTRIIDNMTSNILKHADPALPVRTYVIANSDRVFVHFENFVPENASRQDGNNIGCRSAARQAETMGGNLITEKMGNRYYAILTLPTL